MLAVKLVAKNNQNPTRHRQTRRSQEQEEVGKGAYAI